MSVMNREVQIVKESAAMMTDGLGEKVIPRRAFLKGAVGLAAAITAGGLMPPSAEGAAATGQDAAFATQTAPRFAYVGCYTGADRGGHGKGISVYRIDPLSGDWTQVQLLEAFNPSFLALDHRRRFLYSAHGDGDYVSAFAIDQQTGELTPLNRQSSGAKNAAHLSIDPTDKFLVTANYSSGSVTAFPINEDGSLDAFSDLVALPGDPGPHKIEQPKSRPHFSPFAPSGRFVVVADKGLDKVFVFRLDASSGKLIPNTPPWVKTRSGAGPRHVAFHPSKPYAYVLSELDSTFTTYGYDPQQGILNPIQIIPTLPATFTGNSVGAGISMASSGKFLYGSNRGHNSVATFAIDQATGMLSPVGWEPTQGVNPRFITLSPTGEYLYAANMESDNIVVFRVNKTSGKLTPTGQVLQTGSPSCIAFL